MNITDLIVEFIQQGNVVEFPGMGTLSSSIVGAHHDAATGTFHPARRTVAMADTLTGNKAIVRRIAEKECVTNEIAEQMWANYIAALKEKLQRSPDGHEFPGIGWMRCVGSKVRFDAIEGLDLDAGKKHEQPLENISTYTPKAVADPFAAFDKPAAKSATAEPTPVQEPPVEQEKPEVPPVVEKPVQAEPDRPNMQEPAKAEAPKVEAPKVVATPQADHLSEVKRMLDEIPSSPKDAKEARRAEKAAAKAEKEARKAADEARKAAEEAERKAAKNKEREAREASKALEKQSIKAAKAKEKAGREESKKNKKKKKGGWVWILLVLLLLAAAAWYYCTHIYSPAAKGESCAREVELVTPEPFTESDYPLLKFQEQDILYNVGHLHNYMEKYVHDFLAAHHYANAFAPVMARVDEYADVRLHELMVEGYSPKRFFPHDNFWLKSHYRDYKSAGARYYRYKVQGELMGSDMLEGILDEVVATMGLHADGFGMGRGGDGGALAGGTRAAAAKPAADKPYEEIVPEAPTFKESKQGFDIVAGFFTSKKSANKCANQLKALGSDAYIISKSGGYYVSMGSAPTRTAAEAMEKHIKSWYKSDVKIYNFNE
jgi:hypothetical protein